MISRFNCLLKIILSLAVVSFLSFYIFPSQILAFDPPQLLSPSPGDITTDTNPTLSWNWSGNCFSTGNCFLVQIDNQSDFSSPEKSYYTSNTSYSPQLDFSTWYWRVKAKNLDGVWSDWSIVGNFSIIESVSPSPTPTPTDNPSPSPTPTETPVSATYKINEVKDQNGNTLSSVQIYVDGNYVHHYAPESMKFCDSCECYSSVPCHFGTHTITLKKNEFVDWSEIKNVNLGGNYEVNPIMYVQNSSSTNAPSATLTPSPVPTPTKTSTSTPKPSGQILSSSASISAFKNESSESGTVAGLFMGSLIKEPSISGNLSKNNFLPKVLAILAALASVGGAGSAFWIKIRKVI